jgi:lipopolysaccharide transport system ATP-binding protein
MNDIILKAQNISKQYRLGVVGTGTLGHDINRFWAKLRGKDDPYLQIGAVNDRSASASSDYVWALNDINFEVKRGEILGIIGKNGAGKSTLLKLLSRVTSPTTGSIKTKGRIASLLEVGTGMHPELTGRENIFLNGAILGMTKIEITAKIDEIVDFSGCQMYIDTPVKRYSSGMRVRLGFAVAAFLEPDILVVDEVLAVGDAEFQKKAIGKMQDISQTGGRTVLIVSHNMGSIQQLCDRCIVLKNGEISFDGATKDGIEIYLTENAEDNTNNSIGDFIINQDDDEFRLDSFNIYQDESPEGVFYTNLPLMVEIKFELFKSLIGCRVGYDFIDLKTNSLLFRSYHDDANTEIKELEKGEFICRSVISSNLLKEGSYFIQLAIGVHNKRWIIYNDGLGKNIEVKNLEGINAVYMEDRPGLIMPSLNWETIKK